MLRLLLLLLLRSMYEAMKRASLKSAVMFSCFVLLFLFGMSTAASNTKSYDTSTIAYRYETRKNSHQQPRMTTMVGDSEEGESGGRCEDMRSIQSAVIRILNAQHEYDKGIHALHDMIEALKKDFAHLRKQMEKLADDNSNSLRKNLVSKNSVHLNNFPSTRDYAHPRDAAGISLFFPPTVLPSASPLSLRLDNLTFIVAHHNHRLSQLDKRLRQLLKQISLSQGDSSNRGGSFKKTLSEEEKEKQREKERQEEREKERKKEEEKEKERQRERDRERERLVVSRCEREMSLAREMTTKQRDINAHMHRKMQELEKMLEGKIHRVQGDAPRDQQSISRNYIDGCPSGFMRHLSSCYMFENATANWIDAEKKCQALNHDAHLVSIENAEEEDFIIRYRSHNGVRWSTRYVWIGANDMVVEGRWSWVASGSEVTYSNWRTGEPSNYRGDQHCAYLQTADTSSGKTALNRSSDGESEGRWDDWHCHSTRINFICEIVVK